MAQKKKPQVKNGSSTAKPKKKLTVFMVVSAIAVVLVVAVVLITRPGTDTSTLSEAEGNNSDLVIPISEISETVKFYPIDVNGTQMEIIAVKAPDGTIRTAFNTCQVCYDSGRGYYKQDGDVLVCQNCGNRFTMDRVEVVSGGCNPWPIFEEDKTVTNETITISYDFLKGSKDIFANWKQSN